MREEEQMIVAICDDDELQVEVLKCYANESDFIDRVEVFDSVEKLLFGIEEGRKYDVLLMDIEWKQKENGIDYAIKLNELRPECQVIFFSNYTKYSQDIFKEKINLCGFLLKPVDQTHFDEMINRAEQRKLEATKKQLAIRNRNVTYTFFVHQIIYIESVGHRVIVHADREDIECYESLSNLAERLKCNFAQCHKSYLVNMDRIKRIVGDAVIFDNEQEVNMSRLKAKEFQQIYFDYLEEKLNGSVGR